MDDKTSNEQIQQISLFYMYISLYGLTFVFVFTANMMLVYGFYKTSRPFKIVTKLFIYLSTCEVVLIFCLLLNSVILTLKGRFISDYHHIIFYVFVIVIIVTTLLIFWTISFLRFLSIFKPMYRIKIRTIYKILLIEVSTSFLVAITIQLGYILCSTFVFNVVSSKIILGLNLLMIFVNLTLNMSSLIILRRSTNLKTRQKKDNVLGNPMVVKQKKRALNTLLLITIVHLVLTLPATCMSLFDLEFLLKYDLLVILVICQCLQISTFGIDSFIVILRTKNLREFYRLKCCMAKVNSNARNRGIELAEI